MQTFRIVYGYSNRSNQGTNKTFQIVAHKGEKCKMLEEKKIWSGRAESDNACVRCDRSVTLKLVCFTLLESVAL